MVRKVNKDRALACRLRILYRTARQTYILIERHCLLPHFVAVWHGRAYVFTDFDGHCVRAPPYRGLRDIIFYHEHNGIFSADSGVQSTV
jgi:hypothetical protein